MYGEEGAEENDESVLSRLLVPDPPRTRLAPVAHLWVVRAMSVSVRVNESNRNPKHLPGETARLLSVT